MPSYTIYKQVIKDYATLLDTLEAAKCQAILEENKDSIDFYYDTIEELLKSEINIDAKFKDCEDATNYLASL